VTTEDPTSCWQKQTGEHSSNCWSM